MSSAWRELLRDTTSDSLSGASAISGDVAEVLIAYGQQASPASIEELKGDLRMMSRGLLSAQPTMASVVNLLNAAWDGLDGQLSVEAVLAKLQETGEAYRQRVREAVGRVGEHAVSVLSPGARVVTISASGTVMEALLRAQREGLSPQVLCLEARPMLEGRACAARLAESGVAMTLAVDAAAYDGVRRADVLLVGVDSLTPGGLVGKIGTASLALVAQAFGVPSYALADLSKVWPASLGMPGIRERPADEIWPEAPQGVQITNRYFDIAEWAAFQGVVTENGVLRVEEVLDEGRRSRVHDELAVLYSEVSPPADWWYLYLVSCSDNTLYTGITTNLKRRIAEHNRGRGAAYTAARRPVELRAAWVYLDQSAAMRAEHAMKRRTRVRKQQLIEDGSSFAGGSRLL